MFRGAEEPQPFFLIPHAEQRAEPCRREILSAEGGVVRGGGGLPAVRRASQKRRARGTRRARGERGRGTNPKAGDGQHGDQRPLVPACSYRSQAHSAVLLYLRRGGLLSPRQRAQRPLRA